MLSTKVSVLQIIHRNCIQIALRSCSQNSRPVNSDNLQNISLRLSDSIPQFFVSTHDFRLYNSQIIFEDNIRNVKTHGINSYIKQLSFVKFMGHIKYSHIKMQVLKITTHPEDNTVRVRWRVVGVPGLRIIFMFWNYKLWKSASLYSKDKSDWIDGFSVFYVGNDGLIHKHVVQKIMPDEERSQDLKHNSAFNTKLALCLGFAPNETQELYNNLVILSTHLSTIIENTKFTQFG